MDIFKEMESNVRSYCRNFPVTFDKAKDSFLYDENEIRYIDFFAGAGALNYGHNNEYIKNNILSYLLSDRIIHGLDMYTNIKKDFILDFTKKILKPKNLCYKLQFCGPTGTNAVEASLKLARKVKNRAGIFSFMGGFHGMTLGSLSVTSNKFCRRGAGIDLGNVVFMPYPVNSFKDIDTIKYIDYVINDSHSGMEKPAAIIFETVQAEGGVNIADNEWIRELRKLCDENDILLICDDIQVGCGRTGSFFSFERAGIIPDMVILSKSISGYGLPMSLLLIKPELDIWEPGEHNGTFRGNQLAFVGARSALQLIEEEQIDAQVAEKEKILKEFLNNEIKPIDSKMEIRGIGMIWGIDLSKVGKEKLAQTITHMCFDRKLIVETTGRNSQVIKILPSLVMKKNVLREGCEILKSCMEKAING